jgi:DNA invertase Pin-like site-specific DNA recombinase
MTAKLCDSDGRPAHHPRMTTAGHGQTANEHSLYNVGMYLRLSRDSANYRGGESDSIGNQQAMLLKFASMMPGWIVARTYIDDGASGGNFNRKGFRDMMEDVRGGVINLVLVKDLSRFGRNYLEAGKYLEKRVDTDRGYA